MMMTTTTTTTLQHTTSLCVYLVSYLPFLHVEFAWDGFSSQGISGILQRNHQPLLFSLSFSPSSCSKYFKTRNSWEMQHPLSLEHLQLCFVCDLCKNISRIQVLVILLFYNPTTPIKLKLGLQIGGRLLIVTHQHQPDYLANRKQRAVNKFDLSIFIRLLQG